MKLSSVKSPTKKQNNSRYSCVTPLKKSEKSQKIASRRVTFDDNAQISVYFQSNSHISKKEITQRKVFMQKHINQSKKLINQIAKLKEELKIGRKQRKILLQEMQIFCEKENHYLYNSTTSEYSTKAALLIQQTPQIDNNQLNFEYFKSKVIADSFLGSFRLVFRFYVELYFLKIALAFQLKNHYESVFNYIIKFLDKKQTNLQHLVEIDEIALAIYRLIRSKDADYRIIDIKYGLKKCVPSKFYWKLTDFAQIFQQNSQQLSLSHFINPSSHVLSMTSEDIIKSYFEIFAKFYDTQIKFKKICKANLHKFKQLLNELSLENEINVKLLAQFLYFDEKNSKNCHIERFSQFFQALFGTKNISENFLKWIYDII